ncbi:MAG: cupin domain-containing protein [Steroidobacteraceae bacterium]
MKTMHKVLSVAALTVLGFASASIQAQDSAGRKELSRADLSGAPGMEVILSITELKPGDVIGEHFHHGIEAGYIIQGGTVEQAGKPPITFADGSPIMNLRDVLHGGYKVIGTKTLKLVTVHVVDKGKPLYDTAGK